MRRHDLAKKRQWKRQTQRQTQWQRHLEDTFKEQSWRLLTFETFDQSDEETWPDQKKTMTKAKAKTKTKTVTKTNTYREHLQRAILETCDLWNIWSEWWGDMTISDNFDNSENFKNFWQLWQFLTTLISFDNFDNPRDLWLLRLWWQFWQLRTWIHSSLCYLTIKSDTGQHSQFLRCFYAHFK